MSSEPVNVAYARRSSSSRGLIFATVFGLGALVGLATQGALDHATDRPRAAFPPPPELRAANAPAAPLRTAILVIATPRPCPCDGNGSMSDAAYAALHPSHDPTIAARIRSPGTGRRPR